MFKPARYISAIQYVNLHVQPILDQHSGVHGSTESQETLNMSCILLSSQSNKIVCNYCAGANSTGTASSTGGLSLSRFPMLLSKNAFMGLLHYNSLRIRTPGLSPVAPLLFTHGPSAASWAGKPVFHQGYERTELHVLSFDSDQTCHDPNTGLPNTKFHLLCRL